MSDDFAGAEDPRPLSPAEEAAVHDLLAALPDPEVPADVEDRIAAALAAPLPAPTATVLPAGDTGPGSTPVHPSGRWRHPRLLQVAAALVVVGLITAVGIGFVSRGGSDGSGGSPVAAGGAQNPVTASGTTYAPSSLAVQVQHLLSTGTPGTGSQADALAADSGASTKSEASPNGTAAGIAAATALMRDPTTRQACLDQIADSPGEQALAIDVGLFKGKPAAVIVLPDPTNSAVAEAWVVGSTCSDADNPFPYQYERVPRP